MKGTISDRLEQVLQNSEARTQLRRSLTQQSTNNVTVGTSNYTVRRVQQTVRATNQATATRRNRR